LGLWGRETGRGAALDNVLLGHVDVQRQDLQHPQERAPANRDLLRVRRELASDELELRRILIQPEELADPPSRRQLLLGRGDFAG